MSRQETVFQEVPETAAGERSVALGELRAAGRNQLISLVLAMRPRQWLKNGLVFVALIFSIERSWSLSEPDEWWPLVWRACAAFAIFCAISAAGYLINDIKDLEADRVHPTKSQRPLASGTLNLNLAAAAAAVLSLTALAGGYLINIEFGTIAMGYFALTLAYSYYLKHIVLLDLMAVAAGFVLRTLAGALAIDVPISPWLYLCTLLGALFLVINKRRTELVMLDDTAVRHRPILGDYSVALIDQMSAVVTAATILAYSLYTFSADTLPDNDAMAFTIPFVIYGLFRYLYLVHRHELGGSPEEVLYRDRPMALNIAAWLLVSAAILAIYR
ncbi:MAG TPA: decaprenyl-phosphate phosphoribosyltransferase [Dehalococcoidia bacterium]|nr:decaprenyl-phosphate phosphoribosyltransferase [Dehalococcoidia bacterium]